MHACAYVYLCVRAYVLVRMYTGAHVCGCVCTCVCAYVCPVCTCACVLVRMYMGAHVCGCVCAHIHQTDVHMLLTLVLSGEQNLRGLDFQL